MKNLQVTKIPRELLVVSFFEAPLSFSEEPCRHFSPVNAFLPAEIKAIVLKPEKETKKEQKEYNYLKSAAPLKHTAGQNKQRIKREKVKL